MEVKQFLNFRYSERPNEELVIKYQQINLGNTGNLAFMYCNNIQDVSGINNTELFAKHMNIRNPFINNIYTLTKPLLTEVCENTSHTSFFNSSRIYNISGEVCFANRLHEYDVLLYETTVFDIIKYINTNIYKSHFVDRDIEVVINIYDKFKFADVSSRSIEKINLLGLFKSHNYDTNKIEFYGIAMPKDIDPISLNHLMVKKTSDDKSLNKDENYMLSSNKNILNEVKYYSLHSNDSDKELNEIEYKLLENIIEMNLTNSKEYSLGKDKHRLEENENSLLYKIEYNLDINKNKQLFKEHYGALENETFNTYRIDPDIIINHVYGLYNSTVLNTNINILFDVYKRLPYIEVNDVIFSHKVEPIISMMEGFYINKKDPVIQEVCNISLFKKTGTYNIEDGFFLLRNDRTFIVREDLFLDKSLNTYNINEQYQVYRNKIPVGENEFIYASMLPRSSNTDKSTSVSKIAPDISDIRYILLSKDDNNINVFDSSHGGYKNKSNIDLLEYNMLSLDQYCTLLSNNISVLSKVENSFSIYEYIHGEKRKTEVGKISDISFDKVGRIININEIIKAKFPHDEFDVYIDEDTLLEIIYNRLNDTTPNINVNDFISACRPDNIFNILTHYMLSDVDIVPTVKDTRKFLSKDSKTSKIDSFFSYLLKLSKDVSIETYNKYAAKVGKDYVVFIKNTFSSKSSYNYDVNNSCENLSKSHVVVNDEMVEEPTFYKVDRDIKEITSSNFIHKKERPVIEYTEKEIDIFIQKVARRVDVIEKCVDVIRSGKPVCEYAIMRLFTKKEVDTEYELFMNNTNAYKDSKIVALYNKLKFVFIPRLQEYVNKEYVLWNTSVFAHKKGGNYSVLNNFMFLDKILPYVEFLSTTKWFDTGYKVYSIYDTFSNVSKSENHYSIYDIVSFPEYKYRKNIYVQGELTMDFIKELDDTQIEEGTTIIMPFSRLTAQIPYFEKMEQDKIAKAVALDNQFYPDQFFSRLNYDSIVNESPVVNLHNGNEEFYNYFKSLALGPDDLIIPDKDYDYTEFLKTLVDEQGNPLNVISKVDNVTYIVKYPGHHPLPEYNHISKEWLQVDGQLMQLLIDFVFIVWRKEIFKFGAMDSRDAVAKMLDYLEIFIYYRIPEQLHEQAFRIMRMIRWFGESAIIKTSKYKIKLEYEDYRIPLKQGYIGLTHKLENAVIDKSKAKITNEFIGHNSTVELIIDNKVDTEVTSMVIANKGKMNIYVNDEFISEHTGYTREVSIPILEENSPNKVTFSFITGDEYGTFNLANMFIKEHSYKDVKTVFEPNPGSGSMIINELIKKTMCYNITVSENKELIDNMVNNNLALGELVYKLTDYFNIHHANKHKYQKINPKT